MKNQKSKKQITVLVPVNAPDLQTEFGSRIKADKVRTLFFYLNGVQKMMMDNENFCPGIDRESGYRPVNSQDLQFLIGNDYKKLINHLERLGILELRSKSYVPGMYSKLYRIRFGSAIKEGDRKFRQEYITHESRIGRITEFFQGGYVRQRKKFLATQSWYKSHLKFIESLRLDDAAAEFASIRGKRADKLLGSALAFNNGMQRFIVRDTFGQRIHHQLGVLPKELRPYLKLNGSEEQLALVDVKNAQPFLIAAMLYKPGLLALLPGFEVLIPIIEKFQKMPDVRLFFEHCAEGQLNEIWMKQTGKSKTKSKMDLMRHVFYSSESDHHVSDKIREERLKTRMLFRSLYPSVAKALGALKRIQKEEFPLAYELTARNGKRGRMYAVPALVAQRLESRILHDLISMQLAEMKIPAGTIHDAWVMREKDLKTFKHVFRIAFETLGIRPPMLTTELLKPEDNNIAAKK